MWKETRKRRLQNIGRMILEVLMVGLLSQFFYSVPLALVSQVVLSCKVTAKVQDIASPLLR